MNDYDYTRENRVVICNRCGENCIWLNDGRGWYLGDEDGDAHVCDNDASIDDFNVINKGK